MAWPITLPTTVFLPTARAQAVWAWTRNVTRLHALSVLASSSAISSQSKAAGVTLTALACRRPRYVPPPQGHSDRLRNVHFISGLMESGVDFVAVDMPQTSRLTVHILAAVAEHELEAISQRTNAALAQAKARGRVLGNPRLQEARKAAAAATRTTPAPEVVQIMRDRRAQGDTLRQIADRLNRLEIRTPRGFRWYAETVIS